MKEKFEPGKVVKGVVSGIEKYGIFVNFENGYTGMIHISEVSEKFVRDLNIYAKIGEIIPCKILEINDETKKIRLTIKNLEYQLKKEEYENRNFQRLQKMLPIWIEEKMKELH